MCNQKTTDMISTVRVISVPTEPVSAGQQRMDTMIKRHISVIGALAVAALFSVNDAKAVDGKTYPGLQCSRLSGGSFSTYFGTVTNASSTSDMNVICPFVHDQGDINSASVQVFNRNPSVAFSCTLHYEYASGSGIFGSDEPKSLSTFGSNVQTMSFGAQTGADYVWAECTVPRTSASGVSHLVRWAVVDS